MNTPLSEETLQRVKTAIYGRRKIEAIKILREATNLELKEAKDWVDSLTTELQAKEPEKFSAKKGGCTTAVFALGLLALVVWGFVAHG